MLLKGSLTLIMFQNLMYEHKCIQFYVYVTFLQAICYVLYNGFWAQFIILFIFEVFWSHSIALFEKQIEIEVIC